MHSNPYRSQPPKAFWKSAVGDRNPLELIDLYTRKFSIKERKIASAGSCFAQHIGRAVKENGFSYLDEEPPPPEFPSARCSAFGYRMFSARYGNIYTTRQLLQLFQRAYGEFLPVDDSWALGTRCADPFRPAIEPDGFGSDAEMRAVRESHLRAVRQVFETVEVFVFTFGLTEGWVSRVDGTVYPMCPGTIAGEFDPAKYQFKNFLFSEILADMLEFIDRLKSVNGSVKFLFTVSPVPLTATATDQHVLSATSLSKSILRAVAGELYSSRDDVDYFPSYEIIASAPMRGMFFAPNMREVSRRGVDHVMSFFFEQHGTGADLRVIPSDPDNDDSFVQCEERILQSSAR